LIPQVREEEPHFGAFFPCADFQVREELYIPFLVGGAVDIIDFSRGDESFDGETKLQGILVIDEVLGCARV
jgi:hypothetical protein